MANRSDSTHESHVKIPLTEEWLSSKQTMKLLKITGCELMHKREAGLIDFRKSGNAFFYKLKNNIS